MQAAWAALGFEIVSGQIWNIPDEVVNFADKSPETRTLHDRRYVLILQGDDWEYKQICETILVAPLSSQTGIKRDWEALIEPSETISPSDVPAIGKPSLVKLQLIQPIHRQLILATQAPAGVVNLQPFLRIQLHLAQNLSITST